MWSIILNANPFYHLYQSGWHLDCFTFWIKVGVIFVLAAWCRVADINHWRSLPDKVIKTGPTPPHATDSNYRDHDSRVIHKLSHYCIATTSRADQYTIPCTLVSLSPSTKNIVWWKLNIWQRNIFKKMQYQYCVLSLLYNSVNIFGIGELISITLGKWMIYIITLWYKIQDNLW